MAKRVIVIGAGWSGLAAAKTYLQIDPSVELRILDADSTVGGVWSASRVYPGLIADSPVGLFEFADMTMVDDEHPRHGTITGQEVHEYLQKYAEKAGLLDRITFNTRVSNARRKEDGWQVTTEQGDVLDCEKLIVASGLSSKPNWPDIPNDGFKGPVIHSVSLGTDNPRLTGQDIESIAVLGGCKSSIEAANICLNAGKKVYWVIRDKGSGAGTIIILNHQSKIKIGAIAQSRLFSTLFPSIFNIRGFSYRLLHSGKWKWGTAFLKKFWSAASKAVLAAPGYERSSNGLKIRPEIEKEGLMWTTTSPSVLPSDTKFLPILHAEKQLLVCRATPISLSQNGMHLSDGSVLPVSAVVYATGWSTTESHFSQSEELDLGLPIPLSAEPLSKAKHWERLEFVADQEVCSLFPRLSSPPPHFTKTPTHSPHRLHRNVISPNLLSRGDRSVTFVGLTSTAQTASCSELTALWAVAWMEDLMPPSFSMSKEDLEMDVARVNTWMWRRYLNSRARVEPNVAIEIQTFFDALMRDLGLSVYRRQKGIFGILREYLTPYKASDYHGVIQELLERVRKERMEGVKRKDL